MRIIQGQTENVAIDSLKPHPRNPREGDIGAIHESINNNGFYGSVLAQKSTGFILAGNHRWQAMLQAGATEIPVTWIDVDDDHALRILLADNRTNDLSSYNLNQLADLLTNIYEDTGELGGTGYDGDDLDQILNDLNQDWYEPTLEPTLENKQHTHNDINNAQNKLDKQFDNEKTLREVMCPSCGEMFFID